MKLKRLLSLVAMIFALGGGSLWAQTDVTSTYIQNAELSNTSNWTFESSGNNNSKKTPEASTNGAVEFYHTWSNKPGTGIGSTYTFKMSQKVTLPAGHYRLVAHGFYREGDGNGTSKAKLFAGNASTSIKGLPSGTDCSLTNSPTKFANGDYKNELGFIVDEQSQVEIGVSGYIDTYCSWCVVGSFTLYSDALGANGIYYLYNPSQGTFLSRGDDYGYQSSVDDFGIPFYLKETNEAGKYKIQFADSKLYLGNSNWSYTDKSENDAFVYEPTKVQATNNYYLKNNQGNFCINITETNHCANNGNLTEPNTTEDLMQWQFVSPVFRNNIIQQKANANAQAIAQKEGLQTSSVEELTTALTNGVYAAVDMTSSVQNAALSANLNNWAWANNTNVNKNPTTENSVYEVYEGSGKLSQKVTGLKEGVYKVTVNAMFRMGSNANCVELEGLGVTKLSTAYLMANGSKQQIADWASQRTSDSTPNGRDVLNTMFSEGKYNNDVYAYVDESGELTISLVQSSRLNSGWFAFRNVTLTYYSDEVSAEQKTAILSSVPSLDSKMDADVKAALYTAKSNFEADSSIGNYNALSTAIDNANSSIADYAGVNEIYTAYNTKVEALDESGKSAFATAVASSLDAYNNGTIENLDDTKTTIVNAYYTAIKAQTTDDADYTGLIINSQINENANPIGWVDGRYNRNEQYTGAPDNSYFDAWNGSNKTFNMKQDITLPAGVYTLKAATRAAEGVVGDIYLNESDPYENNKTALNAIGNQGGELGNGWAWTTVENIILAKDQTVTIGFYATVNNTWAGADNFTLVCNHKYTEDEKEIMPAKNKLLADINSFGVPTTNVGDGAFQYPTAGIEDVNNTLAAARAVAESSSATLSEVQEAQQSIDDLYLPAINGPKADTRYTITNVSAGYVATGKAMTYLAGARADMGNYNIQYLTAPNPALAQAFIFTPVAGEKNTYTLSQIDNDGLQRYICTGTVYGGNNEQIRTTTTVGDAAKFVIKPMAEEGNWTITNVAANNTVGANNDNGVFTQNKNFRMAIAEVAKAEVTMSVNADVKWATFITPFTFDLPSGVDAYEVANIGYDEIRAKKVNTLSINTPYILHSDNLVNITKSGYGLGAAETYEQEGLVGTYKAMTAEEGTYVLQNHSGRVAFFMVGDTKPAVNPFRAYIKAQSAGARDFLNVVFDDETAINEIENTNLNGDGVIYDLAGRRVNNAVKGIYIINGKKVIK